MAHDVVMLIGLFSTNVNIPTNIPDGHFYIFGGIVVGVFSILCLYTLLVWYWWRQRRRNIVL